LEFKFFPLGEEAAYLELLPCRCNDVAVGGVVVAEGDVALLLFVVDVVVIVVLSVLCCG
jgi:hypothetical protein